MRFYSKCMEDERFSNVTLVVKLFCFGFPLLSKLGGKHKHWERLFFFYIYIFVLKKTSSIIRNTNKTNKKYIEDRF